MHPYGHGVWKKRMIQLFHTGRGVDEYRYPVEPTSLSANFTAVFPEVASLLNSYIEHTVILNDVTHDKIRSWEMKETKLSSYIGWRVVWRKPCLYFRVWLRFCNKIMELIKNKPCLKKKTTPAGQTSNMGCTKP